MDDVVGVVLRRRDGYGVDAELSADNDGDVCLWIDRPAAEDNVYMSPDSAIELAQALLTVSREALKARG